MVHKKFKDINVLEDYWKYINERIAPLHRDKGYHPTTSFGDNTGHMVWLWEFEDTDAFSKIWNDKDWQRVMSGFPQVVKNVNYRLGRPPIMPD